MTLRSRLGIVLAAGCAAVMVVAPAQAAITIGGFTLTENDSFGVQTGVHSVGTQVPAHTLSGFVNGDGSAVSFNSSDLISITGAGLATVQGPMSDLSVTFAKAWDDVTFAFTGESGGLFSLSVNGTDFGFCSICVLDGKGEQKFTLSGSGITDLDFSFNPDIQDAKQFRVDNLSTSAVPEPASWALMLIGFGAIGGAMRRRRAVATTRVRMTYA